MKMNSLDALAALVRGIGVLDDDTLATFHPERYAELVEGRTAADLGSEPIVHMRDFQAQGALSERFVAEILERKPSEARAEAHG